jgi:hypothetical protein
MHDDAHSRARRRYLQAAAAAACIAGPAIAPVRAQGRRRYAVVSLVGDRLVVVYAGPVTGTLLDPNRQRVVLDAKGAMDQFALAAVGKALEAGGEASATLLAVPPSPLHEQAERLIDGPSVSLPGSIVDALEQSRATHLVMVTKHRADASIPLLNSHKGTGKLHGLGYYVDLYTNLRIVETGATGRGMLAPYAYLKLTLADARTGQVLNQRLCAAARPYAVAAHPTQFDPWDLLSTEEKVARLRDLLERELAREIPLLVAA